jgi:uncharacterized membrane protein YjjP (DUF1212 family)
MPLSPATVNFLTDYGLALHKHGLAAHNLESVMTNVAHALRTKVDVFSTPTLLLLSLESEEGERLQIAKRLRPGDVNLDRLSLLDELGDSLIENGLNVEAAQRRLSAINRKKANYPAWLKTLSYGIVALAVATIFSGSPIEILVSGLGGLIVGFISNYLAKAFDIERSLEFLLAFVISLFTYGCFSLMTYFHLGFEFNSNLVNISSLIYLVPGVSLTISMAELATENLVSGTARLMGAVMVLLKLVFGLIMGIFAGQLFFTNPVIELSLKPEYPFSILAIAILFASIGFTFLLEARFRDIKWIMLSSFFGFGIFKICSFYLSNPFAPTFIAALIVGLAASLYARYLKHPAITILLPGITLLVPGSMGLKGLTLVLEDNTVLGLNLLIRVFFTGMAIVAGLLLANILIPPRRSL